MRLFVVLALVLVTACGARSKAPPWPEMAEREDDGGESLAPRQPSVIAELSKEKDADEAEPVTAAEPTATKPTEEAKPDAATPTLGEPVIAPEEVIDIDDIVIEIEE